MSHPSSPPALPDFARTYPNLASPRLGAQAAAASDEFFASRQRMLNDADAIFIADKYDDHGKWMDGWETRRRRPENFIWQPDKTQTDWRAALGHDWCLIKLGASARLYGADIDTSFFTGNYPPEAALEGCMSAQRPDENTEWRPLLRKSALKGDAHNYFELGECAPVNWVRLNIFPDGGVARLRLYGQPQADWNGLASRSGADEGSEAQENQEVELSALTNGARILGYSDAHYGSLWSLLMAGRATNMGDGWETQRRRGPGHDWIVIALGAPGFVNRIEIDTAFFKGNYPDQAAIQAAYINPEVSSNSSNPAHIIEHAQTWPTLLPAQRLEADKIHHFGPELLQSPSSNSDDASLISHIRLNIFPDGGISRLRIFGTLCARQSKQNM